VATILVADDNSNIQKMVGLALKDHGIDVVAVGNGEAAVRRIPDVHPDLILADIFMPVKNGYEVCEFVKKDPKYSHIPVILLVGAFDPLDEHEAQRVGADGVLKKPFIPPDPLINMVKSALARAAESKRPAAVFAAQPVLAAVSHSEVAVEQSLPSRPAAVSFGDSERPLAFGSLLETETAETEPEAETYVAPVPHPELSDSRNWGAAPVEEEVEEEEEPQTSWRASAVPDELLTDAAEQTPERSGHADAVLTEKEGLGASAEIVAAESASVEAVPVAPSEGVEHDFFAHHEQPQQEASPIEPHAGSQDSAEVAAPEAEHKPTPESEQEPAPEVKDKKDYETVFNPDAFPGLFVEEKPPSPIEWAEKSLQDSPSAFAELSTGVTEPAPSNAETHSPETQPTEAPIPSK
jgi:CheY-like chemotaxis protein